MKLLTMGKYNLFELSTLDERDYNIIKNKIREKSTATTIQNILEECRKLFKCNANGAIVLKYLLYTLNNKIIKDQTSREPCNKLSNLYLKWGCIPFEQMPFCSSLINHNPKLYDLFDIINPDNREHELLANFIKKKY